ncbi:nucleoporin NUP35 isoform X2 [Cetorhinus maximus]
MEFQGSEPMALGSPTSPKPGAGAQFLPGFLMGDLPSPVTPQPRNFCGTLAGITDVRSPFGGPSMFSPTTIGQHRKATLSPAQADPFYTQGESLTSDDHLDDTWITVFGFPPASASYILLQFAQYGNILKHVMSNNGNWMHIQYQSKLQARKALSKDGKIFGEAIMVGVKPCIDKSVMEIADRAYGTPFSVFSPPSNAVGTPIQSPSTPRTTTMRPLAAAYKASSSDYQVISDRQTPRKDESLVSKAMEYMFGW